MKRFALSVLAATLAAFVAMNAHTIKVKAQVLGTGMAQTMTALTLSNTTNQLVLGTTNTVTLSSTAPSASRTYTLDDAGSAAHIGLFAGAPPAAAQNWPQTMVVTGSNYQNATTSFTTVTGLSFAVAASTNYLVRCHLQWQNTTQTVDYKLQFTGPAAPTAVVVDIHHETTNAVTGLFQHGSLAAFSSAYDPNVTLAGSAQNYYDVVDATVVNGTTAGTVALQMALHAATGTLQVNIGSSCSVQ